MPSDMSRLVNKSDSVFIGMFNSKVYRVPPGKEMVVPTAIAKHFVGDADLTDPNAIEEEIQRVKDGRGPDYSPDIYYYPIDPMPEDLTRKKQDLTEGDILDRVGPRVFIGNQG